MSLINYIEPVDPANTLMAIGPLIVCLVVAYIFYRIYIKFAQWIDIIINKEVKHEIFEEVFLDRIAAKKGIDLNKELIKKKIIQEDRKKTFRKRIEEQMYSDMFGPEKKAEA